MQKAGLRATRQRLAILKLFNNPSRGHLSAEEIHQLLSGRRLTVALSTIYRVLTSLEALGILRKSSLKIDKSQLYELDSQDQHDHLICVICGQTIEFVDTDIETRQRAVAEAYGFTLEGHQLNLRGTCQRCSDKAPGGAASSTAIAPASKAAHRIRSA